MALKAVFIGINKHGDAGVPELNGARRDALALWALFSDTFSDLSARLLLDEDATREAVNGAISEVLSHATPDDVIVVSFAGHGSPDGSLVLYDTIATQLGDTALPMAHLAEAFKKTRARAVLIILDCCFSGHAPARVLETGARPRSAFVLADIYGEGRILLSACASDQAAWEQPGTGHGLLTFAVMRAMTDASFAEVQFPDIGGEIIRHARAEGERIGVVQTPVFLGSVSGGLSFPVLHRGDNFNASFPSTAVRQVSGGFGEFTQHGFSREVVTQWTTYFPKGSTTCKSRPSTTTACSRVRTRLWCRPPVRARR